MNRKKKIDRSIESLAKQNKSVNHAIDRMVEYVSTQQDAELRSDWGEIQKTSELIVVQDLVFGHHENEDEPTLTKPSRNPGESKQQSNS